MKSRSEVYSSPCRVGLYYHAHRRVASSTQMPGTLSRDLINVSLKSSPNPSISIKAEREGPLLPPRLWALETMLLVMRSDLRVASHTELLMIPFRLTVHDFPWSKLRIGHESVAYTWLRETQVCTQTKWYLLHSEDTRLITAKSQL